MGAAQSAPAEETVVAPARVPVAADEASETVVVRNRPAKNMEQVSADACLKEMIALEAEIDDDLSHLVAVSAASAPRARDDIASKLKTAKQLLLEYRLQVRGLPDSKQGAYSAKTAEHTAKQRSQLAALKASEGSEADASMSARAMRTEAARVQDESAASARRCLRLIDDSRAVGAASLGALSAQHDQMRRVDDRLDETDAHLVQAKAQVRIARRIAA
eukprot:c8475_g1_i1.p1 GENE.c8475_g1_i1~~c8475_g1_i1.p1  ORF type:complete len:218 (+),score=17.39 c8475_g1_i1:50-703(+)